MRFKKIKDGLLGKVYLDTKTGKKHRTLRDDIDTLFPEFQFEALTGKKELK